MSIQDVAAQVVSDVNPTSAVDPTLVLNVALAALSLLAECQKRRNAAEIKTAAANPGLAVRWATRRAVARHTGLPPIKASQYAERLLQRAAQATDAELEAAIAEARSELDD